MDCIFNELHLMTHRTTTDTGTTRKRDNSKTIAVFKDHHHDDDDDHRRILSVFYGLQDPCLNVGNN